MSQLQEVLKVLLCSFIASFVFPVTLVFFAFVKNLNNCSSGCLLTVINYGTAIWLFSLIATLAGAIIMLALRKVTTATFSFPLLAITVTAALMLVAFLVIDFESALSLTMAMATTLIGFIFAWWLIGKWVQ